MLKNYNDHIWQVIVNAKNTILLYHINNYCIYIDFTISKIIFQSIQYLLKSYFKYSNARMKKTKNCAILLNLFKSLYNQDLMLIYNDWKIITTDITLGLFAYKSSLNSQK